MTISKLRGRVRARGGECPFSVLLILLMPESVEISRLAAWKPCLVVVFAACFATFVSIASRGAILIGTACCGFGKLDVCNVNLDTIALHAVGRTLLRKNGFRLIIENLKFRQ